MEIKADIVDYMGKYENGVLVLINLGLEGKFYEGTLFYSDKDIVLTVDIKLEEKLEMPIEYWEGYTELLESLFKRLIPYEEISKNVDDIDFEKYISYYEDDLNNFVLDEINPNKIIAVTSSNLPQ